MKRSICFFSIFIFLLLCFSGEGLFASGRREAPDETVPVNTEYVFCITAPDVSALPLSRQIAGDTVVRSLARSLSSLDFRFRGEEESSYYRDYAWAKVRADASKALAAKRNERDLLVYRGDPSWRYRKNLKAVDNAIAKLEEELVKIDSTAPSPELKPLFKLTDGNRNGTYPAPPKPGNEYRFCVEQKADAFLTSSLSEYHGRIYLNIRMYTLHTRSFSFEDSVLFSSDDLNDAMVEISGRLASAVSETFQSVILVHANPPEAMVLIDGSFAGLGETEKRTHLPGVVEVAVRADNYVPVAFPLELNPGELAEVRIDLTPLGVSVFNAAVPGRAGSKVFLGGLYVGETPLTLELPRNQFSYISVETPEGEIGSAVYRDNNLVKGNAQFVWQDDRSREVVFGTKKPVSPEEKRVDRARRGFYGAYGAFWIILPVSLLVSGVAVTNINAGRDTELSNAVYVGANITWGLSLGVTLIQIIRYCYIAGADATPIVKAAPP